VASSGPATTLDAELLADRVRLFFKTIFLIELGLGILAFTLQHAGLAPDQAARVHDEIAAVRTTVVVLLGVGWFVTARFRLSHRVLVWTEATTTVLFAASYAHMGMLLPTYGPAFGFMLVGLVLVLRSALIPSRVYRTVVIGLIVLAAPTVAMIPQGLHNNLVPNIWLAVCGSAFVVIAAVISSVIYGLERAMKEAERLGQYELKRLLGEGGMGVVYEATHVLLRRPTAVKLLPIEKIGAQSLARFEREVVQTSRLEHPNSVTIYDYGHTPDGQFYYAMEYLSGLDLQQLSALDGPLPAGRVRALLSQCAHALAEAHTKGLVHRDVKPANIMVCDRGGLADTIKVLDFGLVKDIESSEPGLTQQNSIVGTPHYLAPESIRSADGAVAASDVYALGGVGFFLLTGREVFEAPSVIELCSKHLTESPRAPSAVLGEPVHPGLEALVLRCLSKEPSARFENGGDMARALDELSISGWSAADARDWWDGYDGPPQASADKHIAATGQTLLAVDVEQR